MYESGPCWSLTDEQRAVLLNFVKNDRVFELGCGDLSLARLMATRAKTVFAVDKQRPENLDNLPDNLQFFCNYYDELRLPEHIDCVVACWPQTNKSEGFMAAIKRAFRVVYIGCNTDGSACGDYDLWLHLTKRMLYKEVRHERNCLHCYSLVTHADPQFRSEEEVCGLLNHHGRFQIVRYNSMMVGELRSAVPA
jgi:hypothetical protein